MSVEFRLEGDKLTAVLSGELDHHNGRSLREAIDQKASQVRPNELVLDFTNVGFMDSSGIGLILGRYRWMKELGGSVQITKLSPRMEQLLVLSGIHKLVRIDSWEEAQTAEKNSEKADDNSRDIFSDSTKEVNYRAK